MRILVLGHTGFVGQNLLNKLITTQHHIMGGSRSEGVYGYCIDLLEYEQIKNYLIKYKPDVIYNLACHGGSMKYVRDFAADVIFDNTQMALNLYKAVNHVDPKIKIIQPFSNCSYPGDSSVQHEDEWLSGEVHPSVFSYGNAKRSIYYISKCYNHQYNINSVNLLLPNTYGPGDSTDPNHTHALNGMIIRMIQAKRSGQERFEVWGTGKPIREWAYIDDFIEALVRAIDLNNMVYPVNVGQEQGYSIAESAKIIKEQLGYKGEIFFDTSHQDGDPCKILSKDNFNKLFTNFKWFDHTEGIANTIKYYEDKL